MADEIDILQVTNALRELQATKDKYNNLRDFFDNKSKDIFAKIEQIENNNQELVAEIKNVLSELNPFLNVSPKGRKNKTIITQRNAHIIQWFRENQNEEMPMSELLKKFDVPQGCSAMNLKKFLVNSPEIRNFRDINHRKRMSFSYRKDIPKSNIKISEKSKKEEERAFGIAEENKELSESMPKKFSYMK